MTEKEIEEEGLMRAKADEFKEKLKERSKKTTHRIGQDRNILQKIRLTCNQITPDNFEKKFEELQGYIF